MARAKMWGDGKEFYTKAILVLTDKKKKYEGVEKVVDEKEERKKERELEEACYVNRALCNLELSTHSPYGRRDWIVSADENGQRTTEPRHWTVRLRYGSIRRTLKHIIAPLLRSSP